MRQNIAVFKKCGFFNWSLLHRKSENYPDVINSKTRIHVLTMKRTHTTYCAPLNITKIRYV